MNVGKNIAGQEHVIWSKDGRRMYFDGYCLVLDEFKGFVLGTISKLKEVLMELLFEDLEYIQTVDLNGLNDNHRMQDFKYSYLSEEGNGLSDGGSKMLKRLERSVQLSEMISTENGRVEFKADGMRRYLSKVTRFLELLFLVVHITAGQPGRGTEITSVKYLNMIQMMRGIYVMDGQVMLVTEYYKSREMTDEPQVIARFLSYEVGVYLTVYLSMVLPFIQLFEEERNLKYSKGWL